MDTNLLSDALKQETFTDFLTEELVKSLQEAPETEQVYVHPEVLALLKSNTKALAAVKAAAAKAAETAPDLSDDIVKTIWSAMKAKPRETVEMIVHEFADYERQEEETPAEKPEI